MKRCAVNLSLLLLLVLPLQSCIYSSIVIPLDKDDPTYGLWKKRRDDLQAGRDPGPIAIQRYPFASFRSIKIARSNKAAVKLGSDTLYRLKLVGTPTLALPCSYDKRTADDEAVPHPIRSRGGSDASASASSRRS